mmetsp:Transcript_8899/g.6650  ORF Transcript_8899/g.6650 Transcript_8899/m.6650 type:complete len:122 (-) Transcript_8899:51-416(-)
MSCCPTYLCQYDVKIFKGEDMIEGSLYKHINKCVINMHTCCSTVSTGVLGHELEFAVMNRNGEPDGMIKKHHSNCWNECCGSSDKYELHLPHNEEEAALTLAAIQFLDMIYFENPYAICAP